MFVLVYPVKEFTGFLKSRLKLRSDKNSFACAIFKGCGVNLAQKIGEMKMCDGFNGCFSAGGICPLL